MIISLSSEGILLSLSSISFFSFSQCDFKLLTRFSKLCSWSSNSCLCSFDDTSIVSRSVLRTSRIDLSSLSFAHHSSFSARNFFSNEVRTLSNLFWNFMFSSFSASICFLNSRCRFRFPCQTGEPNLLVSLSSSSFETTVLCFSIKSCFFKSNFARRGFGFFILVWFLWQASSSKSSFRQNACARFLSNSNALPALTILFQFSLLLSLTRSLMI